MKLAITVPLLAAGAMLIYWGFTQPNHETTTHRPTTTEAIAANTTSTTRPVSDSPTIPGITYDRITSTLGRDGWRCEQPFSNAVSGFDGTTVNCALPGTTAAVSFWGSAPDRVVGIQTMAVTAADRSWLSFMAALPYTGADPENSKLWLLKSMDAVSPGHTVSTSSAALPYTLSGGGSAPGRTLLMGYDLGLTSATATSVDAGCGPQASSVC